MIILLNLLPLLIFAIGCYWAYLKFTRNTGDSDARYKAALVPLLTTLLALLLYFQVQPSYVPKGKIERTSIPEFEYKKIDVKDSTLKPMSGEERDERRKSQYKEILPFVEQNKLDNQK